MGSPLSNHNPFNFGAAHLAWLTGSAIYPEIILIFAAAIHPIDAGPIPLNTILQYMLYRFQQTAAIEISSKLAMVVGCIPARCSASSV